jgi:heat shock protein HslJ
MASQITICSIIASISRWDKDTQLNYMLADFDMPNLLDYNFISHVSDMMNKDKFLPLLVIILLAVGFSISCNNVTVTQTPSLPIETQPSSSPTVTTSAKLIGTQWVVVSVNGTALDKDTNISLNFYDNGTFGGNAICNSYGGKYTTEYNNTLKMTDITLTLLLCNKGNQAQADNYLKILSSVLSYKITQNSLVLQGKDDKELVILQLPPMTH